MEFHLTVWKTIPTMSVGMPTIDTTKKPVPQDWHRADIKAALEKKGWSLRRLASANDYSPKSLAMVLSRQWPAGEALIAEVIGVPAPRIWPTRYDRNGLPKTGARTASRSGKKNSTRSGGGNAYVKGAR